MARGGLDSALPGAGVLVSVVAATGVRKALRARAKQEGRRVDELLQYYAMERFLYRLSISPERERFILKGALLLRVWDTLDTRATRDIDMLGRLANDPSVIRGSIEQICAQQVPDDGVFFDTTNLQLETITEDADYLGVRVRFLAYIGSARQVMRLDIGFGDAALVQDDLVYPTLLDHPAPVLRGYARESSIAEKYQAMVKLGLVNSRMKDYYDIWLLSRQFTIDGRQLQGAIEQTFERRATPLEEDPPGLRTAFAEEPTKRSQWQGFVRRARINDAPSLTEAVTAASNLLLPPTRASLVGEIFKQMWHPSGFWKT